MCIRDRLLSAFSNLYKYNKQTQYLNSMNYLFELLLEVRSIGFSGYCWGLNYDYANRYEILPAYSPSIVVTLSLIHI